MTTQPKPRRLLPVGLALLVAGVAALTGGQARAQNTDTIDIDANTGLDTLDEEETLIVNIADCRASIGDTWRFTIRFSSDNYQDLAGSRFDYSLKIERASGACTTELGAESENCELLKPPAEIPSTFEVGRDIAFNELAGITTRDECDTITGSISLVVVSERLDTDIIGTNNGTDTDPDPIADRYTLTFKTTRPAEPTALDAVAGEDNIRITFEAPANAPTDATYNAYFASDVELMPGVNPEPLREGGIRRVVGSGSTSIVVDSGLSVGQTYDVAVVTVDDSGNESVLSEVVTVTTTPTLDFWEVYQGAGGASGGGFCAVSSTAGQRPATPWWLLGLGAVGLVALGLRRRRGGRQVLVGLLAAGVGVAALLASPTAANAQLREIEGRPSGTFELRIGTYLPSVDDGLANPGPYEQVFDNETMLLAELEFERVVWDDFGLAGVAFDFGFMQAVGKARTAEGGASVDTTVFNIIPLRIAAVYRFDYLAEALGIPFVLVGKAGLDYYIWWITTGSGAIARGEDGSEGFGGTFGYHIAPALHLHLDYFNERSANNLKYDWGVHNSYFFIEYLIAQIDDFGSADAMNLSDAALMFGLAFDY